MGEKGEEEKRERWLVYVNIKAEAGPDLYHQPMIKFSPPPMSTQSVHKKFIIS